MILDDIRIYIGIFGTSVDSDPLLPWNGSPAPPSHLVEVLESIQAAPHPGRHGNFTEICELSTCELQLQNFSEFQLDSLDR